MTITMPTTPAPNNGAPMLRDFGGVMTPFLGGPEQLINRVGTRFGFRYTMPIMETADQARVFVSRLLQGRRDRVLMRWPHLSFNPGNVGTPLISSAVISGSAIVIKGLPANYAAKEGQFFSIISGGRRYMHMFSGDGVANGSGVLSISIFPMLRKSLSVNDVVEMAVPMIEGHVSPGDEMSWELSVEKFAQIEFSVMEAA